MCAIAGVIGHKIDENVKIDMLESMARRGPDGNGVFCQADCTLLHTRLAIIDPKGGAQPMQLNHNGRDFVITYNGELYNTEDLRRELLAQGHNFVGHSDTEVLLHGYAQWGEGVLEKLNGIYAFAIWESKSKSLFMARDRMGVKPFFYALNDGVLVFASEIKTILQSKLVDPLLDNEGILEILMLGPGRKPGSGVFKDIMELEPGFCARLTDGKFIKWQYWKMKDRPHTESFDETVERVRWLVTDAIKRQMVSDVSIGTFLSGGLDSSVITAICAAENQGALNTFSVDYENNDQYFVPGKFQPDSDNEYIDHMRAFAKTNHHKMVLSTDDLLETLNSAVLARDLPGMADVDASLLAFSTEIRKHVKAALSGECADEIFGGYPWYRDREIRDAEGFPWAQNSKLRASFMNFDERICLDFVHQCYIDTINKSDIMNENSEEERRVKEMVNLNVYWFMQTLLDRKDRMSMYNGLEVRVPFCDHRIAEYLYIVPWAFKDHGGREKGLLRKAMEGVLPDKVLYRKKSPYPKTFDPEYERALTKRLKHLLNTDSPIFHIINKKSLQGLLETQMQWPWYGQLMRRPQTIAYFLQIDHWLHAYNVRFV